MDFTQWYNWKWQIAHCIQTIDDFENVTGIRLEEQNRNAMQKVFEKFPLRITPYYLSLVDKDNFQNDPIFKQAFGAIEEIYIANGELRDPLAEDLDSPVIGITHRYPDRVLFYVSNQCSMYCRHCTRKRKVGDCNTLPNKETLQLGVDYIAAHREVRDVLISGGDPLMLSDDKLEWILSELRRIDHVEIIRIGTRMPVVLPFRFTNRLIKMMRKYHPIWINTHFNHPREITTESQLVLNRLADNGFPLGNQSVLLAGVNDCPDIIKKLCHLLVLNRVRPYYIYQCDMSEGLSHFRTPISKGIEIMECLIGHTSGLAIPRYVVDAPGGGGKIPLMPEYFISASPSKVILRNYEGVICSYEEPLNYKIRNCLNGCSECDLYPSLISRRKDDAIGLEKLLYNNILSLIPRGNNRLKRRTDHG